MRRLFYKGLLADTIEITGSDAHHLMHVMRAKAGQEILVVDDENQVARMEMTAFREAIADFDADKVRELIGEANRIKKILR